MTGSENEQADHGLVIGKRYKVNMPGNDFYHGCQGVLAEFNTASNGEPTSAILELDGRAARPNRQGRFTNNSQKPIKAGSRRIFHPALLVPVQAT